ncbi:NAD(+) synthase [Eshraghiella crossota]|uniref:NAD(+) synthase n=1 Tax=Eshraghiella crossota TaxID=45851 RepID=UPI003FEE1D2D
MRDNFIRCAAVSPDVTVSDPLANELSIKAYMDEAAKNNVSVLVFPELCLTGYTCNDLFLQDTLLRNSLDAVIRLAEYTKDKNFIAFVGLPFMYGNCLYNVAAALCDGRIIGLIPKKNLPSYSEFYEIRHFTPGFDECVNVTVGDCSVPFGSKLLFACKNIPSLIIGAEICEDVWVPSPPSINHALAGATVIVNCSASDETVGKDRYRRDLISGQSARLISTYIYANAGEGESTQDLVFGGHNIIAENGTVLAESKRFKNGIIYGDTDLDRLKNERRRMTTFPNVSKDYTTVYFSLAIKDLSLNRFYNMTPFVPSSVEERELRCEEILSIQAMGLKKRLKHTGSKHAVIGISGGLDSTLALLVIVKAFDMLSIPRENIIAYTMPCFGTTDRTYNNACNLVAALHGTLKEVNIKNAVNIHFEDIGQDPDKHDITYENCQARERTQILMDGANLYNGMVIGTGDLSELALGWATYNGDHMSMYAVNSGIPKTLVRHLVRFYADTCNNDTLKNLLLDILDTPVSPELLPPVDGKISQKTEDLVGPYELHDFFLYYILRFGFAPDKIYRIAKIAFKDVYDDAVILKWLKVFYRRFFSQQFKRSCLPDGPKVGSVAISPRGDLRMPSDACSRIWLDTIDKM